MIELALLALFLSIGFAIPSVQRNVEERNDNISEQAAQLQGYVTLSADDIKEWRTVLKSMEQIANDKQEEIDALREDKERLLDRFNALTLKSLNLQRQLYGSNAGKEPPTVERETITLENGKII